MKGDKKTTKPRIARDRCDLLRSNDQEVKWETFNQNPKFRKANAQVNQTDQKREREVKPALQKTATGADQSEDAIIKRYFDYF